MDNILSKISGIDVKGFYYDESSFNPSENVEIGVQFSFPVNFDQESVGCVGSFVFQQNGKDIVKADIMVIYRIEKNSFENLVHDTQLVLPTNFLRKIAFTTLGTARGVIWNKLERCSLQNLILPNVDVAAIIDKDCYIDLQKLR